MIFEWKLEDGIVLSPLSGIETAGTGEVLQGLFAFYPHLVELKQNNTTFFSISSVVFYPYLVELKLYQICRFARRVFWFYPYLVELKQGKEQFFREMAGEVLSSLSGIRIRIRTKEKLKGKYFSNIPPRGRRVF